MRETVQRGGVWQLGYLLLLVGAGCAAPAQVKPTVAVLPLQAKNAPLGRPLHARLAGQLDTLLRLPGRYQLVPEQRLKAAWPKGRRRRLKPCQELSCQVSLGQRVMAGRLLEVRVERNIMGQCEVFAELIDVSAGATMARARAPGACEEALLLRSLSKAVCYLLAQDAAGQPLSHDQCLNMSQLAEVDRVLQQFQSKERGARDMAALERSLAEEVLQLKGAYQRLSEAGQGPWQISAGCRLGSLYEAYAQVLRESYQKMSLPPAVRRQGAPARRAFRQELGRTVSQKVAPLHEEARGHYARCVARAKKARVSTPLIEQAKSRRGK